MVEPVDEEYQAVERGTPSDTVLITSLANRVQPLVRYDLGDSVTMYDERCPCGSAFPIMEVGGRQGDVLQFETDDGEVVTIFPLSTVGDPEDVANAMVFLTSGEAKFITGQTLVVDGRQTLPESVMALEAVTA